MSRSPSAPLSFAQDHRQRFVEELKAFVRFPSVSAQSNHSEHLNECAGFLARHLRALGLERVAVVSTRRHPLVYAEWRHVPGRPTVPIEFALPDDRKCASSEECHLPGIFHDIASPILVLAQAGIVKRWDSTPNRATVGPPGMLTGTASRGRQRT